MFVSLFVRLLVYCCLSLAIAVVVMIMCIVVSLMMAFANGSDRGHLLLVCCKSLFFNLL